VIYIEQSPPPDLAPWVACFWQISGETTGFAHRVLPDGCADWLLDLQSARWGRLELQLIGPMTTAQLVPMQGTVELLGIRLRPGAAGALRLPVAELLDMAIPADDLRDAPRFRSGPFLEVLAFQPRAQLLAHALRALLARRTPRPDPLVCEALGAWSPRSASWMRVAALARQLGVSERALERRFRNAVGLTPAGFRRLARFRAVLRLHAGGLRDWATLAASCGFSDQSHLVRDFGELAGLSPTAWAATQVSPAGFLQDGLLSTL
jgi:AraC-like DNA-binding protein